MEKKLISYFDSHPDAQEVHVAREVLFTKPERAQEYADLVKGQTVQTVTREDYEKTVAAEKQKEMDEAAQLQSAIDADQKTLAGISKDFEKDITETDSTEKQADTDATQSTEEVANK